MTPVKPPVLVEDSIAPFSPAPVIERVAEQRANNVVPFAVPARPAVLVKDSIAPFNQPPLIPEPGSPNDNDNEDYYDAHEYDMMEDTRKEETMMIMEESVASVLDSSVQREMDVVERGVEVVPSSVDPATGQAVPGAAEDEDMEDEDERMEDEEEPGRVPSSVDSNGDPTSASDDPSSPDPPPRRNPVFRAPLPPTGWKSVAAPSAQDRDPDRIYFDSPPDPTRPKPHPFRRQSDIGVGGKKDKSIHSYGTADRRKSDMGAGQKGKGEVKFQETVRNKDARQKMHATDCPCCREVRTFFPHSQFCSPLTLFSQFHLATRVEKHMLPDPNMPGAVYDEDYQSRLQRVGKHRTIYEKPATPEGYWDMDFPSTQEVRRRNGYPTQSQDEEEEKKEDVKEGEE